MRALILFGILLLPLSVSAHASMESLYAKNDAGILIDVGYDPAPPQVGQRFLLDIALREGEETGPMVDYDSAWVRMSRDRTTYFASGIAESSIGPTTLVLTLPPVAEGEMTLSLRFEKDGEAVAEHAFTLTVLPPENELTTQDYALMGAVGGLVIALMLMARMRYTQGKNRGAILRT